MSPDPSDAGRDPTPVSRLAPLPSREARSPDVEDLSRTSGATLSRTSTSEVQPGRREQPLPPPGAVRLGVGQKRLGGAGGRCCLERVSRGPDAQAREPALAVDAVGAVGLAEIGHGVLFDDDPERPTLRRRRPARVRHPVVTGNPGRQRNRPSGRSVEAHRHLYPFDQSRTGSKPRPPQGTLRPKTVKVSEMEQKLPAARRAALRDLSGASGGRPRWAPSALT